MPLVFTSFFAGFLTILAPCVLSLLPIMLGGSVGQKNHLKPLIITLSLITSVVLFTLILKGTTTFISIPNYFWQFLSGGIILLIGFSMFFPQSWEWLAFKLKFYKAEGLLGQNSRKEGLWGGILLGSSLGPVFTTCSPTYGVIIATVLPANFITGLVYLLAYAIGLAIPLLAIGYSGRTLVSKLKFAANPNGWVKRGMGLLLIITGLIIVTGFDKKIETLTLDSGYLGPISIEQELLND